MIFNTTVCQGVSGEVRLSGKCFPTIFTFMIFNTTVCQGVSLKQTLVFKSFITLLTLKLVLSFVDGAACLNVILAITPAPTHT